MRSKMSRLNTLIVAVVISLTLGLASCSLFQGVGDGLVVTTTDSLVEGTVTTGNPDVFVLPDSQVPNQIKNSPEFKGKHFVVADISLVKKDAPFVNLNPNEAEGGSWLLQAGQFVAGIASAWFPGAASLEALLFMLSRRKRENYKAAFDALNPATGPVDLKEAALSLGRAMGMAHSSEATKAVAEKEWASPATN